ncbi:MAG: winged helix-turn-helix domain-containing protein [Acidobacteriota bacterium]|nr:winged helix-turn-helix domain-containing protein [Acidobacteriota bacterium]
MNRYYNFDNFCLDVAGQRLLKDGKPMALTNKAFLTLLILVQKAGQIVDREEIISEIWVDSFVEDSNLSQYVYILRKILGNNPQGNPYIETITKRGFRFTGVVRELLPEAETAAAAAPQPSADDNLNSADSVSTEGDEIQSHANFSTAEQRAAERNLEKDASSNGRVPAEMLPYDKTFPKAYARWWIISAIAILAGGLIYGSIYFYKNYGQNSSSLVTSQKTKSVAVLPFKSIGGERDNEKLGLGMADAVIMRLSKLKQIPVRSTSAVFRFTDEQIIDSVKIGQGLGVETVLEGTVQREGERIRVSARLINVPDGKALWAESYDETFTDIFAVQDSISSRVAQSLAINLTREQELILTQRATKDPRAFQAYQQGLYFLNKRSKESLLRAIEFFQQAIQLDPNYAPAHAGLADCYNMQFYYEFADLKEASARAREAAEIALSLDEGLAEAHMAMAYVLTNEGKPNLALPAIERAVELSPFDSTVRVRYAWVLLSNDNLEEAARQARLAQEYDQLSHLSNNVLCGFLSFQHKFAEAIQFCEKSVQLEPNAPRNRLVLAKVYFFSGRREEALSQIQSQINFFDERVDKLEAMGLQSYFYAKMGQRAEAERLLTALKSKANIEPALYSYLCLTSYLLGNYQESLDYFRKSNLSRNKFPDTQRFRYDPLWEEIRKDKRFFA